MCYQLTWQTVARAQRVRSVLAAGAAAAASTDPTPLCRELLLLVAAVVEAADIPDGIVIVSQAVQEPVLAVA